MICYFSLPTQTHWFQAKYKKEMKMTLLQKN